MLESKVMDGLGLIVVGWLVGSRLGYGALVRCGEDVADGIRPISQSCDGISVALHTYRVSKIWFAIHDPSPRK